VIFCVPVIHGTSSYARAIEAMVAAMMQQSTAMMQQHEASM